MNITDCFEKNSTRLLFIFLLNVYFLLIYFKIQVRNLRISDQWNYITNNVYFQIKESLFILLSLIFACYIWFWIVNVISNLVFYLDRIIVFTHSCESIHSFCYRYISNISLFPRINKSLFLGGFYNPRPPLQFGWIYRSDSIIIFFQFQLFITIDYFIRDVYLSSNVTDYFNFDFSHLFE